MSLVYKGLSVSCFNGQLQLWVTQHGSLGSVPLSSWPGQMLRVTSKVVEQASHWGKQKCFSNQDWSLQFRTAAVWKSCHLWHNHMNICGFQHFASVWKEIFVSLRRLPQSPCFVNTWVAFSVSETEIRLCTKHTKTKLCTHSSHTWEGGLHEEMSRFHPQSQNQTGLGSGVWGLADCFLNCKGANVQKFANVWKMSPHLNTVSTPFPLVNSCHSPSA